jgi:hypothetical protein
MSSIRKRIEKLEAKLGVSSEIDEALAAGLPEGGRWSGDPAKEAQWERYWLAISQRYTHEEIVGASWGPE